MTNELKQRLVGAAVITAIAAIFLPMLFDDPVQESGKALNDLAIPTPPQVVAPEVKPSTTADQAYPPELSTEQMDLQAIRDLELPADSAEEDANEKLAATALALEQAANKKDKVRMTVEELAALRDKDKKEREKILKEREERTSSTLEADPEGSVANDQQSKERVDTERRQKERLDRDHKTKEKLLSDKKALEKPDADKKTKVKSDAERKSPEKITKEPNDYEKLVTKKTQEKAQNDKKAADKSVLETKLAAKQQAQNDKAAITKTASEKDKLATQKAASTLTTAVPARWFVRVGSFSQSENAYVLRDKLRKQGYPAAVDSITSPGKGRLYRLRVGPELSKPQAEKILKKIEVDNHFKSFLESE